jgi:hypothetical protein
VGYALDDPLGLKLQELGAEPVGDALRLGLEDR